ncbi:hypothetical protein Tco_0537051 [Tanacetum coccineum]
MQETKTQWVCENKAVSCPDESSWRAFALGGVNVCDEKIVVFLMETEISDRSRETMVTRKTKNRSCEKRLEYCLPTVTGTFQNVFQISYLPGLPPNTTSREFQIDLVPGQVPHPGEAMVLFVNKIGRLLSEWYRIRYVDAMKRRKFRNRRICMASLIKKLEPRAEDSYVLKNVGSWNTTVFGDCREL